MPGGWFPSPSTFDEQLNQIKNYNIIIIESSEASQSYDILIFFERNHDISMINGCSLMCVDKIFHIAFFTHKRTNVKKLDIVIHDEFQNGSGSIIY